MKNTKEAKEMWLSIYVVLLCVGMIGLIVWRIHREYVMRKVTLVPTLDPLMKRKLYFFKQKMRDKHPIILLGVSGLTAAAILLLALSQMVNEKKVNELISKQDQLTEEMIIMRNEQNEWVKMSIFSYPPESLVFESIDWEQLLLSNDPEERYKIEQELSYQLSPFLGRTLVLVFVDQPMQEITLTFMSKVEHLNDLTAWEENWARLVEDLTQETLITQSSFSVHLMDGSETSFEQVIVRDDDGGWEILTRRMLSNNQQLAPEDTQHSERSEEVETRETTEAENESEQKGSVTIHE